MKYKHISSHKYHNAHIFNLSEWKSMHIQQQYNTRISIHSGSPNIGNIFILLYTMPVIGVRHSCRIALFTSIITNRWCGINSSFILVHFVGEKKWLCRIIIAYLGWVPLLFRILLACVFIPFIRACIFDVIPTSYMF